MKNRDFLRVLFVLFSILLNWPILTIVNFPAVAFGIPPLVLYLFALWALIILLLLTSWMRRPDEPQR